MTIAVICVSACAIIFWLVCMFRALRDYYSDQEDDCGCGS